MLTKGSDLASFLEVNVDLARRSRISGGTAPRELAIAAREMGFSKFDVSGFMGGGRLPDGAVRICTCRPRLSEP